MSLDLYQRETAERVGTMPLVQETEPAVFDNFWRGAGLYTMRGLARAGRSIDLLGSVGPVIQDAFTGGTTAQDQYFKEHDEVWGSAVDYWTPRPAEVGIAGEVVGSLASMLPLIFASPAFAVGEQQIGSAEDLVRQGVSAGKAQAVGATQAAGLGLGIWVPILGQNLWQRMVVGGAGFNVVQGVATRAVSGQILEGEKAGEAYKAFDPTALTIDVLLGLAFGGWAHLNPETRAQGKAAWEKLGTWAQSLSPSDVDALATLRQAQHLNVDSTPGKPATAADVEAHAQRAKRAIEQVVRGQPVDVEDLPAGNFKPDPARMREMKARADELVAEAERVRVAEDLPKPPEPDMATARAEGNLEALDPAEQARTIGDTVRVQLETTGMAPEEAAANSALWEAFFRTAGKRYGVSPMELVAQYGVNVQRLKGDAKLLGALDQAQGAQRDPTKLPAFKTWFKDSRVVDEEGKPLRAFHGTTKDFAQFDTRRPRPSAANPAWSGDLGTWFAAPSKYKGNYDEGNAEFQAEEYTRANVGAIGTPEEFKSGANVMPVYLAIKKPMEFDGWEEFADYRLANFKGKPASEMRDALKDQGYDGIVIRNSMTDGNVDRDDWVAFEPEQIKSAIGNQGTFDPNNPNILFQDGPASRKVFYSELERQVEAAKMNQAPAKGWKDLLKSFTQKGVKAEELKWSGIEEWLDLQQGKVTKEQVLAFLKENGVKVTEVQLGGPGARSLSDAAIAEDVRLLTDAGFEPQGNPENGEIMAFEDTTTNGGGDMVTADDIRRFAAEEPDQISDQVVQAAKRVEDYFYGRGQGNENAAGDEHMNLVQQLEEQGWRTVAGGTDEAEAVRGLEDGDWAFGRIGPDGETVERWVILGETTQAGEVEGLTPEVLALMRRIEGTDDLEPPPQGWGTIEPGPEQQARPTKFGRPDLVLPGGQNYRELLLTLPHNVDSLPRGYRLEPMAKKTGPGAPSTIDALIAEWKQFRELHNLSDVSADEVPRAEWDRLTQSEQAAIYEFRERWDEAIDHDRRQTGGWTLIGPDNVGHALAADTQAEAQEAAMTLLDRQGVLDKLQFRESHWEDPNVLAHVRFNERTDADGKRVLFIEEIQSDWAQKGKKRGFAEPRRREKIAELAKAVNKANDEAYGPLYTAAKRAVERNRLAYPNPNIEDALFQFVRHSRQEPTGWQIEHEAVTGRFDEIPKEDVDAIQAWVEKRLEADRLKDELEAINDKKSDIPAGPFVGKTEAWVGLVLKRMIREAAERGFDRIAWTTGEQQTARYTSALRKAVDEIEWKKTDKGVQIIGHKYQAGSLSGPAKARLNALRELQRSGALDEVDRQELRTLENGLGKKKVVDTTEKEDVLSDAIGKAMADRIINDPNQSGVISGEGIVVADTGMASFYERIVPNVAKDIMKKLGGGQVGKVKLDTGTIDVRRPDFKPMSSDDMQAFAGAENFPNGAPPLIGSALLDINGVEQEAHIILTGDQVAVIPVDDPNMPEWRVDWVELSDPDGAGARRRNPRDHLDAREYLRKAWESGRLWQEMADEAKVKPAGPKTNTDQPAFDITQEMKKRALQGLPLFQAGAKGQIKFGDGETIIGLLERADRSTFLHETGHFFLQVTRDLSRRKDAPEGAQQDWQAIEKWLGIKGGEIPVEAHEQFARGFEAYLMTGQAPTPSLRGVFERFRDWLISIYESIAALEVELSPEILGVFDRMLAHRESPRRPGVPRPAIEDTPAARKTVEEYKAKLEAGEPIEPVLVDRTNPQRVVDGNHRLQAHIEAGVPADIVAVPATEAITKMGTENWSPLRVAEELGRPLEAEAPAARPGGTEPPPPRGSRGVEAAGAKALEERVEQLGIENEQIRSLLQHMADKETGWAQIGGRLDTGRLARDTGQRADPTRAGMGLKLGTPAFTTWIPKAEWWAGRPDKKMNEGKVKAAVKKALAGEPLKKAEQRTVDYMLQIANQRFAVEKEIGPAEVDAIVADMALGRELEPTTQNIVDADLVAQAREINEAALERAAIQYENDDAGFMAQVRRILEQASENRRSAGGRQEGGAEAPGDGGRVPGEEEGGAREGQQAGEGEEGPDAVTREAERFVQEQPERLITVGTGPDGEPVTVTAREYLESARAEASQARDDAALFEVAAQCLLGGGA